MVGVLTRAGPAEILRASQKDDIYCDKIKRHLYEILLHIGGVRALLKYKGLMSSFGNFLYYSMTTSSGLQTLGEEYTGILQFDTSLGDIPTVRKRLVMVLFSEFGQQLISMLLSKIEKNDHLISDKSKIRFEARNQIINTLAYLKVIAPFLERIHRAVFYWMGYYYHLSKRTTNVQYILVRYWLKNRDSLYGFKLLSIITMIQTIIAGTTQSIHFWTSVSNEQTAYSSTTKELNPALSHKTCPLCLDVWKNVSLTPCGHLFCWYCIHEWLQSEQKCPICRELVLPSRIVPLKNYS